MAVNKIRRMCLPSQRCKLPFLRKGEKDKQLTKVNIKNKNALVIAQEIKFVRLLANNDKRVRDKVLKNLKKWLAIRAKSSFAFTEADFMRFWKGLFYCMWMSDKPLIQEELSESLSQIVHCFNSMDTILLYTKCALKTLSAEWFGIDQYRIDKFAMLVRRICRQTFQVCKEKSWQKDWVVGVSNTYETLLLSPRACQGFNMHITEIYLEELAKISNGKVPEDMVTEFIKPFAAYLTTIRDERQIKHVMRHIFRYLIFQSDVGIEYQRKFEAWKQAGFPCRSIEEIERIKVSDEEESAEEGETENQSVENSEKPLDPRAGRVDVELPELRFNALEIADVLRQYRFHPSSTAKARRQIARLIKEFTEVAHGKMPVGLNTIKLPEVKKNETNPTKAAIRLLDFEKNLYSDTTKNTFKRKVNGVIVSNEDPRKKQKKMKTNELSKQDVQPVKSKRIDTNNTSANNLHKRNKKNKLKQTGVNSIVENLRLFKPKKQGASGGWQISEIFDSSTPSELTFNDSRSSIATTDSQSIVLDKSLLINNTASNKNSWPSTVVIELQADSTRIGNSMTNSTVADVPSLKKESGAKKLEVNIQVADKPSLKKKVKIVLQRNTAQNTLEYIEQLRQSPAIPYDANKKPLASVLKPCVIPSPVNPFYKKNRKT